MIDLDTLNKDNLIILILQPKIYSRIQLNNMKVSLDILKKDNQITKISLAKISNRNQKNNVPIMN